MVTLLENIDNIEDTSEVTKRGIVNVFDIHSIITECDKYDLSITVLPERELADGYRAVMLVAPQVLSTTDLTAANRTAARVALIVDYSTNSAYAMAQGGCDKIAIMYLSSVANKHINEPFQYNPNIRCKI